MEVPLIKQTSKPLNDLFDNDLSVIRQDLNGSTSNSKIYMDSERKVSRILPNFQVIQMLGSKENIPGPPFPDPITEKKETKDEPKQLPVRSEWTMDMPALKTKSRNQDQNDSNILSSDVRFHYSHAFRTR